MTMYRPGTSGISVDLLAAPCGGAAGRPSGQHRERKVALSRQDCNLVPATAPFAHPSLETRHYQDFVSETAALVPAARRVV